MNPAEGRPLQRTAPRIRATSLVTPAQLAEVRARSRWRGLAMVAHAWTTIAAAILLVAVWPNPLTFIVAVIVIGSRQLGLAILMHDGAHGALHPNETVNLFVSQWLCAYPVFAETRAYRRYHLKHHAHTQTDQDPDLVLSRPFPIAWASYRRKLWRDVSGQTGYQQRKAQVVNALGPADTPAWARVVNLGRVLGRPLAVNAALWAAVGVLGIWWAYPLLWLLPLLTWYPVVTRIRNIAEHAVVSDNDDPLRNTRTTLANRLERLLFAPYYVNYHLEHHLFFYVPAYNLPKIHRWLMTGPHRDRLEIADSYISVLKRACARPAGADRPGDIVNAARRLRPGSGVDGDGARAGF